MKKKLTAKQKEILKYMAKGYIIGLPFTKKSPALYKGSPMNIDSKIPISLKSFHILNKMELFSNGGYCNCRYIYKLKN